ncbi:MAG TPA: RNA-binding protein [Candidatus Binataceae bacterium]|nr:RNA-binding protein [Candidatus Binataceae bacterium]
MSAAGGVLGVLGDARQEKKMGRRLYVGNLAWTVTDQDLRDAFAEAGKVENAQVIVDRGTNRSRGFGFVEMDSDDSAQSAIKMLNGRDIKGRQIKVNEAQARTGGNSGGGPR